MPALSFTAVQAPAIAGAILVAAVAAFQLALALGAPLGGAVFGGRAPTEAGVLTVPFRAVAVVQAAILVLLAWVLLARTGVGGVPSPVAGIPGWAIWVVVVFLLVNTVGNFAAPHPIERWVMGSITLLLAGLSLVVALRAP